ncbi:MAG: hypothetical protein AB1Z19_00490, partial [Eubacteriales bacterium]
AETQKLIPEDFDELRDSSVCCFCVEDTLAPTGFAHTVLAHKEPIAYKALLGFGKPKFEAEVGSLLPVYIPICKRCKSAFRMASAVKPLAMLGFVLAGIAALYALPKLFPSADIKTKIFMYSGVILFEVVGYVISTLLANRYVKNHSVNVRFNIFDIDLIGRMRKKGWFLFQDNSASTNVGFSKDPGDFGRVFDE